MSSRRGFLSSTGIAVLGGALPSFLGRAALAEPLPALGARVDPDNVLVVVQMGGGNDGLNTVVPYPDDAYHRVRPTIGLAENAVLELDGRIGFNPALAALAEMYKQGRVAVVQGVGYPNPNRSHFEATQIWETASPDRPTSSGWLGRYLDAGATTRGVTNAASFGAIALGDTVPTALVASHVDVPAIGTLATYGYNTGTDAVSKSAAGRLYDGARPGQSPYLGLIERAARDAMHGGDLLRAKLSNVAAPAVTYPRDAFAQQLALAARIVAARLGTKIVFVSIGSFDTHSGQRAQQDRLLGYLANGLRAFYADLDARGLGDRVLALTFSEFGRRVAQNASAGTDHGTAMPLFVVGGRVKGGVYGDHPSLTDLDSGGDLKFSCDFRRVYATVVERWLGRSANGIIAGTFDTLGFV